jgi:tetratricopeptide (TPR) repeat protein
MKLRPIPKLASNYRVDFTLTNTDRNILMRTKTLLCAGLLAMGSTMTLDSSRVIARDLTHSERSLPKNTIAAQENAESYNRSGNAKRIRGDYQGAIADYNRAIELKPNYANAYFNRAVAQSELGDNSAALADLNRAIALNPNDSDAYNNRGVAKGRLGDRSAAMADYNRALQINPNHPDALYNLANAEAGLRRDQQQRALDQINRVNNAQTCCR